MYRCAIIPMRGSLRSVVSACTALTQKLWMGIETDLCMSETLKVKQDISALVLTSDQHTVLL